MTDRIQTTYRGHIITFEEGIEEWTAQVADPLCFKKQSLAEVKKKIDDFERAESAYKNLPAISASIWGHGRTFGDHVVITSVQADGDVWINRSGKREKIGAKIRSDYLCAVTPENEAKVQEYHGLAQQRDELIVKMKEVADSMERLFKD